MQSFLYNDLPTPDEVREWDRMTHEDFGQPMVMLMENASRVALYALKNHYKLSDPKKILVLAGRGNNGGDGVALARHLHNKGHEVLVYSVSKLEDIKPPFLDHYKMAKLSGVNFIDEDSVDPDQRPDLLPGLPDRWQDVDVIIDAMVGTGFQGSLRPNIINIIEVINKLKKNFFILSLDLPSGLNGLSGKAQPIAVKADLTVSFEAGKPGIFFPEAKVYTGKVVVSPIGIPRQVREQLPTSWKLISPRPGSWAKPQSSLHKGKSGKILIIGGSDGMPGAPVLSALGALRGGAGLVKILCPQEMESFVTSYPEIMIKGVGDGKVWGPSATEELIREIKVFEPTAIVLGPGMGRNFGTFRTVEKVLSHPTRPPVVLDADALYFLRSEEKDRHLLEDYIGKDDILTPHPAELSRILPLEFFEDSSSKKVSYLQENRIKAAEFAKKISHAVTIIKGAGTMVVQEKKPIALCPHDVPSLAVGGSGDVLSGLVASILASDALENKFSAFDAACLGVHLHATAGLIVAEKHIRGNLAHETAKAIPLAWEKLIQT